MKLINSNGAESGSLGTSGLVVVVSRNVVKFSLRVRFRLS